MQNPYFIEKVKSFEVRERSISELLRDLKDTAYQGRKLGEAFHVWERMLKDEDTTIFLGLAGSMSTAGMWKIIKWLIENNYVDVVVSTGANISEDIYEAMGFSYWKGSPNIDDSELYKYNIDRFYDVFASEDDYRQMENLIMEFSDTLTEGVYSSRDFLWKFGKYLFNKKIYSIVTLCYIKKIPLYSPAISDSGYGIALVNLKKNKGKLISLDASLDLEEIAKIIANSKKTGVIYIGGGVPKDFVQISTIVAPLYKLLNSRTKPHYYAIQITTDAPQWGGLSGCTLEEAVSWGKIDEKALRVTCYCDATIALPILAQGIFELKIKRNPPLNFEKLLS
jgi:deoxyhypusine synthase